MFIAPKYAELAAAETSVTFAKVDVDQADDVADDQQINSFPTFKFFKDYQLLEEFSGADLPKIIELVAKYK